MSMIEHLLIDGYKCLKNVNLPVGNLNILVGANASGKSSVLQALLLLRQSADQDGNVEVLHLSGPLYEAGTAQDALNPASENKIKLRLDWGIGTSDFLFYLNREQEAGSPQRLLPADRSRQLPQALYDRRDGFAYLNAERLGPRVTYSLPPDEMQLGGRIGKHGEYTAAFLARAYNNNYFVRDWNEEVAAILSNGPLKLDHINLSQELGETQGRLDAVCNLMLGWIIPGAMFEAAEFGQTDTASVRFIRDPSATNTSVRATHMGFGLIYTLPIIAAALALRPDGLFLIENPEAHLHPFSQSRIGVFLALMAATGRQIFVETHSDHVINGIRLAVKYNLISPDQVIFDYFRLHVNGSETEVTQIRPQSDGRLNRWPAGFFDQIENDLSKL